MTLTELLLSGALLLLIGNMLILLFRKSHNQMDTLRSEAMETGAQLAKIDPLIRSEFARNREESQKSAQASRQELSSSLKDFSAQLTHTITDLAASQRAQLETFSHFLHTLTRNNEEKFEKLIKSNEDKQIAFNNHFAQLSQASKEAIAQSLQGNEEKTSLLVQGFADTSKSLTALLTQTAKENRAELTAALQSFEERFTLNVNNFNELQRQKFSDLAARQEQAKQDTERQLEKIRETVAHQLKSLQEDNSKKLDEMRQTVDEKLQSTLEKRLSTSFTLISERLELVHKGLGEMQLLANSVGDIKKVMTNVKSRGILGEYQLANILEDLLTHEQYERNVKTKAGSGAIVEFAIKLPNNNNLEKVLWMPIDSKFPKEDYEALVDAYDEGHTEKVEALKKSFKQAIIRNAKDIKEKYIDPPHTTEYGLMFLPFESLYAEVLRTPGLFEHIQKVYKITITGPTTLSALLSSLQMGFRTLAIEKRSSEVWDLLGAVKTEFGKFGMVLEKTKKKLQEATYTIDQAGVRSRAIERQLKKVQELPGQDTLTQIDAGTEARGLADEEEAESADFSD